MDNPKTLVASPVKGNGERLARTVRCGCTFVTIVNAVMGVNGINKEWGQSDAHPSKASWEKKKKKKEKQVTAICVDEVDWTHFVISCLHAGK